MTRDALFAEMIHLPVQESRRHRHLHHVPKISRHEVINKNLRYCIGWYGIAGFLARARYLMQERGWRAFIDALYNFLKKTMDHKESIMMETLRSLGIKEFKAFWKKVKHIEMFKVVLARKLLTDEKDLVFKIIGKKLRKELKKINELRIPERIMGYHVYHAIGHYECLCPICRKTMTVINGMDGEEYNFCPWHKVIVLQENQYLRLYKNFEEKEKWKIKKKRSFWKTSRSAS